MTAVGAFLGFGLSCWREFHPSLGAAVFGICFGVNDTFHSRRIWPWQSRSGSLFAVLLALTALDRGRP